MSRLQTVDPRIAAEFEMIRALQPYMSLEMFAKQFYDKNGEAKPPVAIASTLDEYHKTAKRIAIETVNQLLRGKSISECRQIMSKANQVQDSILTNIASMKPHIPRPIQFLTDIGIPNAAEYHTQFGQSLCQSIIQTWNSYSTKSLEVHMPQKFTTYFEKNVSAVAPASVSVPSPLSKPKTFPIACQSCGKIGCDSCGRGKKKKPVQGFMKFCYFCDGSGCSSCGKSPTPAGASVSSRVDNRSSPSNSTTTTTTPVRGFVKFCSFCDGVGCPSCGQSPSGDSVRIADRPPPLKPFVPSTNSNNSTTAPPPLRKRISSQSVQEKQQTSDVGTASSLKQFHKIGARRNIQVDPPVLKGEDEINVRSRTESGPPPLKPISALKSKSDSGPPPLKPISKKKSNEESEPPRLDRNRKDEKKEKEKKKKKTEPQEDEYPEPPSSKRNRMGSNFVSGPPPLKPISESKSKTESGPPPLKRVSGLQSDRESAPPALRRVTKSSVDSEMPAPARPVKISADIAVNWLRKYAQRNKSTFANKNWVFFAPSDDMMTAIKGKLKSQPSVKERFNKDTFVQLHLCEDANPRQSIAGKTFTSAYKQKAHKISVNQQLKLSAPAVKFSPDLFELPDSPLGGNVRIFAHANHFTMA